MKLNLMHFRQLTDGADLTWCALHKATQQVNVSAGCKSLTHIIPWDKLSLQHPYIPALCCPHSCVICEMPGKKPNAFVPPSGSS